jgi:hypothetical protein
MTMKNLWIPIAVAIGALAIAFMKKKSDEEKTVTPAQKQSRSIQFLELK